jgi:hypothetical protein
MDCLQKEHSRLESQSFGEQRMIRLEHSDEAAGREKDVLELEGCVMLMGKWEERKVDLSLLNGGIHHPED